MSAAAQFAPVIGPVVLSDRTIAAFLKGAEVFKPPPKLTLTEWSERNIVFSSEDSAAGGSPFRVKMAPFQRGMMDALLDPHTRRVVFWTSSQIGKTQIVKNVLAYFMREDPSPIIFMLPTLDLAAKVSEQRLAPMFRDCESLRGLVNEGGRRRGNGTLVKMFPGGALFLVGANSPASLSSMPIRIVLADEIDRYPKSAGVEGNPLKLAEKRQTTYWNAISLFASTCTIKNDSAIEDEYDLSDGAKYWVPCVHCGEKQVLNWKRLIFPKTDEPTIENTVYACAGCGAALTEFDKPAMLAGGEWRSERPEIRDVRGFWINELYSPFVTWYAMARQWREAMRKREDPQLLKTFINLSLAATYEDANEKLDGNELMQRREEYPPPALPDAVTVITCGVDVQEDRLKLEIVGHGKGEETWSIEYLQFDGNTSKLEGGRREDGTPDPSPWERLEKFLLDTRYLHARGIRLGIAATLVDSGDQTQTVYSFTKKMQGLGLRCYASKGVPGWGKSPVANWNRNNKPRVKLYPIAVDVLKKLVLDRLKLEEAGAGYMHFSKINNDATYFAELTAEKMVRGRDKRGYPVKQWVLKVAGSRNEAFDCRVMATAAFHTLSTKPAEMLERLRTDLLERAKMAAADRRARVPAGQMSLLDMPAPALPAEEEHAEEVAAVDQVEAVQTSAGQEEAPIAPVVDLAAEEYRLAEKLDQVAKPEEAPSAIAPAAPRRRMRIKRGGWL
jgi:phage terminase large subunit GpA-like protein